MKVIVLAGVLMTSLICGEACSCLKNQLSQPSIAELMRKFDLKSLSVFELLQCFSTALDELKQLGVVRTRNNPTGDYAEWLVAKKLKLKLTVSPA